MAFFAANQLNTLAPSQDAKGFALSLIVPFLSRLAPLDMEVEIR